MNSERMLLKLTEIKERGNVNPFAARTLDDLILSVKQDIALKTAKTSMRQTRYKAALEFARECVKGIGKTRPAMAGAFPTKDGRQAICDGYRVVIYDEPMDGLPTIDQAQNGNVMKVEDVINSLGDKRASVEIPSIEELRTVCKIAKAEYTGKRGSFNHYTKLIDSAGNHAWFNTEYLINLLACVEPTECCFAEQEIYNGKRWLLYVKGDGAEGMLMPINKRSEPEEEQKDE